MNRRSFLKTAGFIVAAPAIVRAESLMKIWTPPRDELLVFVNGVIQSKAEYTQVPGGTIRFDRKNVEYQIYNFQMKTWTRVMC